MKVRYELQTLWPKDVKNPNGYDAIDWQQEGEIPFVPVAGMAIDCGDGDLRKVGEVHWSSDKPGEIAIWFEDEEEFARDMDYYTSGGWTTQDIHELTAPARKKRKART